MRTWPVNPCLRPFIRDLFLPASVLGPVLLESVALIGEALQFADFAFQHFVNLNMYGAR